MSPNDIVMNDETLCKYSQLQHFFTHMGLEYYFMIINAVSFSTYFVRPIDFGWRKGYEHNTDCLVNTVG
jgi:hypothetical protein